MGKIIPIIILIALIVIGFANYIFEIKQIDKRLNNTVEYKNKFVEYSNALYKREFKQNLYNYLEENINAMQEELGPDGIQAYIQDPLKNIVARNYQILINTLPESREYYQNSYLNDNIIMYERIRSELLTCDDCFLRHIGTLKEKQNKLKGYIKNPLKLFSNGVSFILSTPFILFKEFGIISSNRQELVIKSRLFQIISSIIAFVGFLSDVVSIAIGWDNFKEIVNVILEKI